MAFLARKEGLPFACLDPSKATGSVYMGNRDLGLGIIRETLHPHLAFVHHIAIIIRPLLASTTDVQHAVSLGGPFALEGFGLRAVPTVYCDAVAVRINYRFDLIRHFARARVHRGGDGVEVTGPVARRDHLPVVNLEDRYRTTVGKNGGVSIQ